MQNLGYNKPLFILAFDHRSTFSKKMLNENANLSEKEKTEKIKDFKKIIYAGFELALKKTIPKESAGILVDEQFGKDILIAAKAKNYIFSLPVEKSGQDLFEFEYKDFTDHIEKYKPVFVKALVRYNPDNPQEKLQLKNLKILSDWCHNNAYKLLLEPLIEATHEQLSQVQQNTDYYEQKIRPDLAVKLIEEFQEYGVEPDIWKIEGMEEKKDYLRVVKTARRNNRNKVGIIILGRGADSIKVETWLKAGRNLEGVIGFAIGRTIFWDALLAYKNGLKTKKDTVLQISENYIHFYNVFNNFKDRILT